MEPGAPQQSPSAGKIVMGVVLVGLGLTGLGMSLCGGGFAAISLVQLVTGTGGNEARAWSGVFLGVGGFSLVVGSLLAWLALRSWRKTFAR
jgi:hypothetical protein